MAECVEPPLGDDVPIQLEPAETDAQDTFAVLYNKYNTFENFKTYMNSQIIDDTPLILGKHEPMSVTYLRTALYTLENISNNFIDKAENIEIISDQFYHNMLIFDKNIVFNILENIAILNRELNSEMIYQTLSNFLYIELNNEKLCFGLTGFEIRDIRLMNEGYGTSPSTLETTIPNYKIPMDLVKPWKLPESYGIVDVADQLIKDIQTKTGIYQNVYGIHDLPDSIIQKIISDTVQTYHNNPAHWEAYKLCDRHIHDGFKETVVEIMQDYYLQKPYLSKLQTQVYQNTLYYFCKDDT